MKKSVNNKLKMYSALAGTAAVSSLGAQVVFTDINPDTIVHGAGDFYDLDLNGDATPDFRFQTDTIHSSTGIVNLAEVKIIGVDTDAILGSLIYSAYPLPFKLNNGDTIKASNPNWNAYALNNGLNYLGVTVPPAMNYGNWPNATDNYIGLRLAVAGQYHYGWARLSVSAHSDTIIVKEYAYEQTPGQYIICGLVADVPTHQNYSGLTVRSFDHSVFVHASNPEQGGKISIYDMQGQLIREEEITSGEMKIDLENVSTGIYVVHVQQGEHESTQKIYLK